MSETNITERLAFYWRTYADLPSLALHPETPGYTHGMLIRDTRDARLEIERLRMLLGRVLAANIVQGCAAPHPRIALVYAIQAALGDGSLFARCVI